MVQQHNILKITLSLLLMLTGMLPAAAQSIVLQESFDNFDGEGGNDKNWSGITPKPLGENDIPEGWSISPAADGKETVRKGSKCVCIGATADTGGTNESGNAYLITPPIATPGTYVVYFKAGAWNTSNEKQNMEITESESGSVDIEQSLFNLTKGVFKDFSTKVVVKKANSSIRFGNVNRRDNRFFIDEIKIVCVGSQEDVTEANYVYRRATTFAAGKEYLIVSKDSKENLYIANPAVDNKEGFPLIGATFTTSGTIINETDAYDSYLIRFLFKSDNTYALQSLTTSNYISLDKNNKFNYDSKRSYIWTINDNPFGEDGRFIVMSNERFLRMSEGNKTDYFKTYKYETSTERPIFLYEKVTTPPSGTIKISAKEGYGTFYSDKSIIMPEGLCGATVTDVEENGKLKYNWKYNAGDVVPAHTGLLLYASQPGSFDYYEATESTNAMQKASGLDQTNDVVGGDDTQGGTQEVNYLHGTTADETIAEDEALYKFYQLSYGTINGTRTIGFFFENAQGGVFLNKANKAYLSIPRNISAQSAFSLERNNPIMSIAESFQQTQGVRQIFDISGNRVPTTHPLQKGIYIVNGKKLMIR